MAMPDQDETALDGLNFAIDEVLRWAMHVERFAYERDGVGLDASPHLLAAAARRLVVSAATGTNASARYVLMSRDDARDLLDDLNARIDGAPRSAVPVFPGIAALAAAMTGVGPVAEPYLIWSNEHQAWWKPDESGYTRQIERAGRYPLAQACAIAGTRGGGWPAEGNPYEIAIRESDAVAQYAPAQAINPIGAGE